MDERNHKRKAFVKSHFGEEVPIHFLASDMSPRQYFRVYYKDESYVLMDCPPPECPKQFILVAEYIRELGLRAPQIFRQDLREGFILLEDFGDNTFTKILSVNKTLIRELFLEGCRILKSLKEAATEKPNFLEEYTPVNHLSEARVFIEWDNLWA